MHPQLTAALDSLDDVKRELHAAVEAVPVPRRGQKPAPDRWSVNEVLEHLGKVEQFFLAALIAKIETARTAGLQAEVDQPEMLPAQMKATVEDRVNRRIAPEPVQPNGSVDASSSLEAIDAGHLRLRDALRSTAGLALSGVTHDHRFFGTLNVYQWVELIAGHERRHLAQVREIAAQVGAV